MEAKPTTSVTSDGLRVLRALVALASFFAFVLIIACLSWARAVLVPVALALLLTFLLAPVVQLLQRIGLHRTVASILVVLCAAIVVAGIGWVVMSQVNRLAYDLRYNPQYKQHISQKLADLQKVNKGGVLDNIQTAVNDIMGKVEQNTPTTAPPDNIPVVVQEGPSPLATLQVAVQPLLAPLGSTALVVVLVIFMLLEYEELRNRVIGLVGSSQLTVATKALADAGQRISRYLLMQFVINGTYGVAVGFGLFMLGVPYAVLWGFLAGVLRYVPYVGPWIAAVFPITMSLVVFSGWTQLGFVVGLFLLLESWSNLIMEPWLYGQSVGVSQVGLLVVTGFWTWLWGPIGLVLAAPLTVCIIVLGRHVPQLRFVDVLLGDQPVLEPPVMYYQRLLAQDHEEATELVEEYVRSHPPGTVYDEVLIPALLLAWQDRKQGALAAEDESFVLQATRALVEELDALAVEAKGDTRTANGRLEEPAQSPVLIFGCPARHEMEEVIVQMLGRLMGQSGVWVEVLSTRTPFAEIAARITQERPALVFIAALPGGLPQTRYLCMHLHREFPVLPIVVGYWGDKNNFDQTLVRLRRAGASSLVTSLQQTRSRIHTVMQEASYTSRPELGYQAVAEGEC